MYIHAIMALWGQPVLASNSRAEGSFQSCLDELSLSEFYEKFNASLLRFSFQEIICYGLGNFQSCLNSRYQLALLILMKNKLDIKCYCYDPVFTQEEICFLEDLEICIIRRNEEGKRRVTSSTLFYMPHCPHTLSNNILWANWEKTQIQNIVILANSFQMIFTNSTKKVVDNDCNYMTRALQFLSEIEVDNCFRFCDIFNDMSFHTFRKNIPEDNSVWENCPEPKYKEETVEIIQNIESLAI
ncbi:SRR1-like protein [Artemia franciscana]|uniref:SRR1-like protein n=1 Tax=Artemia franciscana TaxID=6661 RepID=UPI0032DBC826